MSATTLTLTVELGMLDAHSSWSEFESLAVQMSREVPLRARRGLTPIFHTTMTPYGEVQLRTDRRLDLTGSVPAAEN